MTADGRDELTRFVIKVRTSRDFKKEKNKSRKKLTFENCKKNIC